MTRKQRVYDTIEKTPGIQYEEIKTALNITSEQLSNTLTVLVKGGYIRRFAAADARNSVFNVTGVPFKGKGSNMTPAVATALKLLKPADTGSKDTVSTLENRLTAIETKLDALFNHVTSGDAQNSQINQLILTKLLESGNLKITLEPKE